MKVSCMNCINFFLLSLISLFSLPIIISSAQAQTLDLDLLSQQTIWQPFAAAIVIQNQTSLNIYVATNFTGELFNRAYLPISVTSTGNNETFLNLTYASESFKGNATFFAEIRDNKTSEILWSDSLNNTNGQIRNQFFVLPKSVINAPIELRFYIITNGIGEHTLIFNKATMSFSNVTKPVTVKSTGFK